MGVKRSRSGRTAQIYVPAVVYNTVIMVQRRSLLVSAWLLAAAVFIPVSFAQNKRPLNHGDYDSWRSISGERLSHDGKFLIYGVFPQEGDGEIVIRNLVTGKEQREQIGRASCRERV